MAKQKIKFVRNGVAVGLAYFAGDELYLETKQAKQLIEDGIAVDAEPPKPRKSKSKPKP